MSPPPSDQVAHCTKNISISAGAEKDVGDYNDDDDDEYGTLGIDDEEQAILDAILAAVDANLPPPTTTATATTPASSLTISTEQADPQSSPIDLVDIEDYEPPHGVLVPKAHLRQSPRRQEILCDFEPTSAIRNHDDEPPAAAAAWQQRKRARQEQQQQPLPRPRPPPPPLQYDGTHAASLSPLQRFRRPPNKALSVTDLVSPAWCELQFSYTLKHGRKRRTAAMKQGTRVHQQLEDEVHVTVPVEVMTVEDSWALRIWNVIQGLATLRETGRTRELEVWGTIGGEIVNGIIDLVSYQCPDPRLKAALDADGKRKKKKGRGKIGIDERLPEYNQAVITEFLTTASQEERDHRNGSEDVQREEAFADAEKEIYITDVKTRTSATLPTGSSTKPTILQLHLYHHMLENLAQGNFSLAQLAQRYNLDLNAAFSDSFITQIASLDHDLCLDDQDQSPPPPSSSQDSSIDLILAHNTLSSLWALMLSQLRLTFLLPPSLTSYEPPTSTPQSVSDLPAPASQPTRISPILTAEYLAAGSRNYNNNNNNNNTDHKHQHHVIQNRFLGRKSFVFDPLYLKAYLEDSLQWWRGERDPRGVHLHEAWKCRSCDFRDDCVWLHERDREAWEKVMARKALREGGGMDTDTAAGRPSGLTGSRSVV